MKKTFAWGFDNKCNPKVLPSLIQNKTIELKFWVKQIREKPMFCKAEVVCYDDFFTLYNFQPSTPPPVELFKKLEPHLLDFLLMNARHQVNYGPSEVMISRQIMDDVNHFYRLVHYFYEKLTKYEIEQVLFANIYHEGADLIVYLLAKAMNIPVLMCYQSLFPNRFFCVSDVRDMGNVLNKCPTVSSPAGIDIGTLVQAPLFYMQNIQDADWHYQELESDFKLSDQIKKHK